MNLFKKAYCRIFQGVFKLALPVLPYKDPKIIDKVQDIPTVLKQNGKLKPLIVTDKTVRSLGLTILLEEKLVAEGLQYAVFDGVVANPTTDNVAGALKIYRVLVAVPTTAGTGSETTLAAVIVDSKTRHKYAINDFPLIPKYAVLDEEITMTLPQNVVATTGMDALTHAIEAFIGKSGNRKTRADALEAIKLVFENLEKSYFEKTAESRKNMLIASHKAGRAFSKSYVGYVHALAHALGGKYNTPHGLANAVILPLVLEEYAKAAHKKLWKIAVYCGLVPKTVGYSEGAKAVIEKIKRMNVDMGIPQTLTLNPEDLDELSRYAEREANPLYPVPVLWDRKKLKKMYLKIGGLNAID